MKVVTLEIADNYAEILTITAIGRDGTMLNASAQTININEVGKIIIDKNGKANNVEAANWRIDAENYRNELAEVREETKKLEQDYDCMHSACLEFSDKCDRLTEENERLRVDNGRYEAENNAQFDKWLKLEEATKRHHAELFKEAKIAVKEDTVKKMQERLSEAFNSHSYNCRDCIKQKVDQIAKEMLEDK